MNEASSEQQVAPHSSFERFKEALRLEHAARQNLADARSEFGEYLNSLTGKRVILSGIISSVIAKVTGENGNVAYMHVSTKRLLDTSPDVPCEPREVTVERIGNGDFVKGMLIVRHPESESMEWVIDPGTIVSIEPIEEPQIAQVE